VTAPLFGLRQLCPRCRTKSLRLQARRGRVVRYRNMVIGLPALLKVPTCTKCQHADPWLLGDCSELLEDLRRTTLCKRASDAIATLAPRYITQRQLELRLDLSPGYVSRLRAGAGVPSATLVCLLALLAADPERLKELEGYWDMADIDGDANDSNVRGKRPPKGRSARSAAAGEASSAQSKLTSEDFDVECGGRPSCGTLWPPRSGQPFVGADGSCSSCGAPARGTAKMVSGLAEAARMDLVAVTETEAEISEDCSLPDGRDGGGEPTPLTGRARHAS
jgi:hypothetical protein